MEAVVQTSLASRWQQALLAESDGSVLVSRVLLARLVDELAAGMEADPFDVSAGGRVGATMAAAGILDPAAPITAARVLSDLSAASARADAKRRAMDLVVAVVAGHRGELGASDRTATDGGDRVHSVGPPDMETLRIALDNAAVALMIGRLDGTVRYANVAFGDLLGVPVDSLRAMTVSGFTHPDDVDDITESLFEMLVARSGTARIERRMIRADGSVRWASFAITYVRGSGGETDSFVAVGEDVTDRHLLQQELHWQAGHDPLTGLPNRRRLQEQIDAIAETAAAGDRIGLCFADLDRFKDINDRYGHAVGDEVLVAVADRLSCRHSDPAYTVARIGGDEFVVLITPPADDFRVMGVADALLSSLATPVTVGEHRLQVTVSIGVVVASVAGRRAAALLDAADRGLYRAKASGKDRWALQILDTSTGKNSAP
jgi:diguanylate cyclase (GGDEF)-like protein/PAS domain S-box-containing protein